MPLDFMSPQQFDAGGPQPSAVGGAAGGFGQLANALAQGPRIHAQAGYMAAEADKARAETQGLTANQAIQQGVIQRQQEAMALASDPETVRDPVKMQRLYALGLADPTIAPHLNSVLGANLALAALNGKLTQRQSDAFNAGVQGGPGYGSTSTGFESNLQNERTLANIHETGATGRTVLEQQGATYRAPQSVVPQGSPPGTPPVLKSLPDVYAGSFTPISSGQQTAEAAPVATVPAGSPPGTPPTLSTSGSTLAQPGTRTPIGPPQQQAEAAPTTVVGGGGRPTLMGTGAATAQNAQPALGSSDATLGDVFQGAVFGGGGFSGGPVTLPSGTPSPGTYTPPTTPEPTTGQPPAGTPLSSAMTMRPPPTQTLIPEKATAEEGVNTNFLLDQAAARHYQAGSGITGGSAGEWGPTARANITARAQQLMRQPGRYFNNTGAAIEAAIQEAQRNGNLPPDKVQGAQLGRTLGGGKNIKEWITPKDNAPATTAITTTAPTVTANKPQQPDPGTIGTVQGKPAARFQGKWFFTGPDGQPTTPVNAAASPAPAG